LGEGGKPVGPTDLWGIGGVKKTKKRNDVRGTWFKVWSFATYIAMAKAPGENRKGKGSTIRGITLCQKKTWGGRISFHQGRRKLSFQGDNRDQTPFFGS